MSEFSHMCQTDDKCESNWLFLCPLILWLKVLISASPQTSEMKVRTEWPLHPVWVKVSWRYFSVWCSVNTTLFSHFGPRCFGLDGGFVWTVTSNWCTKIFGHDEQHDSKETQYSHPKHLDHLDKRKQLIKKKTKKKKKSFTITTDEGWAIWLNKDRQTDRQHGADWSDLIFTDTFDCSHFKQQ